MAKNILVKLNSLLKSVLKNTAMMLLKEIKNSDLYIKLCVNMELNIFIFRYWKKLINLKKEKVIGLKN